MIDAEPMQEPTDGSDDNGMNGPSEQGGTELYGEINLTNEMYWNTIANVLKYLILLERNGIIE